MSSVYSLESKAVTSFVQYGTDDGEMSSDSGDYVFEIDVSLDSAYIAASLSDNSITVCDSASLSILNKISAHSGTINGVEFSKTTPKLLYSCSSDKSVCLWDVRASSTGPVIQIMYPEEVTGLSISISDSLLATGVESSIIFHDIRGCSLAGNAKNYRQLGQYSDAHSDVITQLKFSKQQPQILTSASEDGLLCVFNTAVAEQEEAVISVLNTECPIRRFGYFGAEDEGIYALSTVETASIWHHPSAQRLAHFPRLRDDLAVSYLVDCLYDPATDSLSLLAGDYSGGAAVARLEPSGAAVTGLLPAAAGGHVSTVRCCCSLPGGRIVTGGEDSRICRWGLSQSVFNSAGSSNHNSSSSSNSSSGAAGGGGSGLKANKKSTSSVRHRPY